MTPEDIVRTLCAEVSHGDPGRVAPLLADDVVFINVGLDTAIGRDRVLERFAGYWAMFPEVFIFHIRNLGTNGNRVFTERVDFMGANGIVAPIPCNGVFEVVGGRIAHWRDYADMATARRLIAGARVGPEEGMPPGTYELYQAGAPPTSPTLRGK